jgi:succinoglycan biosynthesis transport protein ExoP
MEIRHYIAILWRRRWVIAVTLAVTLAVVVIGTLMATPIYVVSTTLRVAAALGGTVDYADYIYAERLMNTYAEIATSGPVLEELMRRLGLDQSLQIEMEILPNTELMQITVEDPNPILAREAANALAEILITQSEEFYAGSGKTAQEILSEQLAQTEGELSQARREYESLVTQLPEDSERVAAARRSISLKEETYATLLEQYERARVREAIRANTLSVVEPAGIPPAPSKPRKALNFALGFVVGLVGGAGLAFLFESLDTRLYSTQQIEKLTALTTLGKIPTAERWPSHVFFNGNSPQAEAFRRLRTNIVNLDHEAPLQTLLITSAEPREGKSTVVANLAFALAQSGCKVAVVDGDLRLPTLHKILGLSNQMGLSSVLNQEATLDEVMQDSEISGVWVLTSGPLPSNPAELLGSSQMTAVIEQLARRFDIVLLDTPSLLAVTDAAVLAPAVDGVMLVVGRAQARGKAVQAACQYLADVKARSIGVVVNRAERDDSYYYYHHSSTQRDKRAGMSQ